MLAAAEPLAPPVNLHEMATVLVIWLTIAAVGLVVCLLLRVAPSGRGWLFPLQRQRAVPWALWQVLLCAVAYVGFVQLLGIMLVGGEAKGEQLRLHFEQMLMAQLLAAPCALLTMFAILWRYADRNMMDIQLYQLGITAHRWRQNIQAAWLFWFIFAPITFGVHWFVRWLSERMGDALTLDKFEQWIAADPTDRGIAIFVVSVLIAAPIVEELFFRGIVQPWLIVTPYAADVIMLGAIVFALVRGVAMDSWWPLLFLFIASPGYLAFEKVAARWLLRADAARGIYATSLLFAAIHYPAWPAPIPLFVLGLGLGILAYRTQSLLGPVVMHSLFNFISTVDFFKRMAER